MGTGFTIDTPLNVAKYGISSVVSLVDDLLIEKMRKQRHSLLGTVRQVEVIVDDAAVAIGPGRRSVYVAHA